MERRFSVPAVILVGLVISVAGTLTSSFASLLAQHADHPVEIILRWNAFHFGCSIAGQTLLAAGLVGLADRSSGMARTALRIAVAVIVLFVLWRIARPVLGMAWKSALSGRAVEYVWRGLSALWLVATVALSIGARAWTRPASPWVTVGAVFAIVVSVFGGWTPYFGSWLIHALGDHPTAFTMFWLLHEIAWVGGLFCMIYGIGRLAIAPTPDPGLAVRGFRTATHALYACLLVAVALALLASRVIRSPDAVEMMLVIAPVIALLATIAFAWGVLAVDRAELEAMPRIRLAVGVALSVWASVIRCLASRPIDSVFDDPEAFSAWTIVGPLIGIAGVILVLWAIYRFAVAGGPSREALRESALGTGVFYLFAMLIATGLPHADERNDPLAVASVSAIAALAAVIVLARLMAICTRALSDTPQMPEARVRD